MLKKITCFVFLFSTFVLCAQQDFALLEKNLSSLKGEKKSEALISLSKYYSEKNPNTAMAYAEQALDICTALNSGNLIRQALYNLGYVCHANSQNDKALSYYKQGLAISGNPEKKEITADILSQVAECFFYESQFDSSLFYYNESKKLFASVKNNEGKIQSTNGVAGCYVYMGNYENALKNYFENLKLAVEIKNGSAQGQALLNIGNVYFFQEQYKEALENYNKSLPFFEQANDKEELARLYNNIGTIYEQTNKMEEALDFHLKALRIKEETGNKSEIAKSLTNLGNVYFKKEDFEKAKDYYQKSFDQYTALQDKNGIAIANLNLGTLMEKQKNYKEALLYIEKTIAIGKEIGRNELLKHAYGEAAVIYSEMKDFENAYLYHKYFSDMKDSVISEERVRSMTEMSAKYESEKKQNELLQKESELTQGRLESEKKTLQRNILIGGIGLLLVAVGLIFRSNRQKNRANKLLGEKSIVIYEQHKKLEEKNQDIVDSINYAKRIQDALLTSDSFITQALPKSFVFYKPKDIISGDFYWSMKTDDNRVLFLTGDCTGHGIPGAFMSLLCISFLNEIVLERKIFSPDKILSEARKEIIRALNPDGNNNFKDGMDCVLTLIDQKNKTLEFATANNPLWILRNTEGNFMIEEFKADKFPVGVYEGELKILIYRKRN